MTKRRVAGDKPNVSKTSAVSGPRVRNNVLIVVATMELAQNGTIVMKSRTSMAIDLATLARDRILPFPMGWAHNDAIPQRRDPQASISLMPGSLINTSEVPLWHVFSQNPIQRRVHGVVRFFLATVQDPNPPGNAFM